jgi:tetratricopeptide (TPR) repeat protein
MASVHRWTRDSNDAALQLFYKAIELDPEFATALGTAAYCYVLRKLNGWMANRQQEIAEAVRLARRAVELGKDDAVALSRAGMPLPTLMTLIVPWSSSIGRFGSIQTWQPPGFSAGG